MDLLSAAVDIFLHLDKHLNELAAGLGPWLYVLLVAIVFCETGLVVTPFLPGDSLLFAVGALAATPGSPINLPLVMLLLMAAAILGDAANYAIGKRVGPRVFSRDTGRFLNKKHLLRAQEFYERHGGKAIILSRFLPILRTFAPFVAGIGQMNYPRFAAYNITGGVVWTTSFLVLGYLFGNVPIVKNNFHLVLPGIVIVSLIPIVLEFFRARREAGRASGSGETAA